MEKLNDLEYLKLTKFQKFLYGLKNVLVSIPLGLWHFIKNIGNYILKG